MTDLHTHEDVRTYYGEVLKTKADLQTTACCPTEAIPVHLRSKVALIADEIQTKFYGCGSPIPDVLEGCTVLDLGCGTGRDVYLASQLVGEQGRVIGIDMTPQQLEVARKYQDEHRQRFGHERSNVSFHEGYMEKLDDIGVEDSSVDVAISNCVINLAPDKKAVFREILRVLKPGGELYFSDVFSDRRLSTDMKQDPVLVGECLGGALYVEDFRRMMSDLGIRDYRVIASSPIEPSNPELEERCGNVRFYSMTIRVFNLPQLEDRCEDYGQVAWYLGTIDNKPHRFGLDDHHIFLTGKPMPVCSNTASMLADSRLAPHFRIDGNTDVHFGIFDCGPDAAVQSSDASPGACC
ncbi:MAG: methyltransferase type 11 [Myxococcales bacterium]|nr:methyltransferase type 11 [Myxococcales bacterium]|tara:strand:+ start:298 stop:1350 length:1053 start_codon:yes stop_codon:yes gene_type:complete